VADTTFGAVFAAVEGAMVGLGFRASPLPLDTPKPGTFQDRGWSLDFSEIANTDKLSDRDRAEVAIRFTLHTSHMLRPFPDAGKLDLVRAGDDHLKIMGALMGDAVLNAQGRLNFRKWPIKRSKTAEHLVSEISFVLKVEVTYPLLDG